MTVSQVAIRLQQLREAAGFSYREFAERLGMSKSKYEHYEKRYKKRYLPADFAAQVASVLSEKGVPIEDVMSLAGSSVPDVPADSLNLAARYSELSPQRQRAMRDLLEALEAAETLDRARPSGGVDADS